MEFAKAVELFKCLGDETRLRILALLRESDSYVELLASRLDLTPGTVSHHLKKLEACGLVRCARSQFYMIYSLERDACAPILPLLPEPDAGVSDAERYERQVIASFVRGGRLTAIPAQLKKREIVYRHMLAGIAPGQSLSEPEVNDLIHRFHEDHCTIRRDMISLGLLTRERETYTRV